MAEIDRVELARQIRNEYYKQWRKDNKEKTRQYNQNKWLKKAEKLLQEKEVE
jgi:hypothetical protein